MVSHSDLVPQLQTPMTLGKYRVAQYWLFVNVNAPLKRRMGVERSTGALAIVNHHNCYRLGTGLTANSEVLTGTLAVHYIFLMKCKYPPQERPSPESRPRADRLPGGQPPRTGFMGFMPMVEKKLQPLWRPHGRNCCCGIDRGHRRGAVGENLSPFEQLEVICGPERCRSLTSAIQSRPGPSRPNPQVALFWSH